METEYLGYKIEYYEIDDEFRVNVDGIRKTSKSIKELKKQIDNIINPKIKFKRVPCFFSDLWSKFKPGFITSVAENNYGASEVWTVDSKKQRSKRPVYNCFLDTDANRLKIEEYKKIDAEINKLKEKADAIKASMETYK